MNNKIIIINGPNLNLLGEREQSQYGSITYDQLKENCSKKAKEIGLDVEFSQSNVEGELVNIIQDARKKFDGIIINAAAFTHTSVAIRDALDLFKKPIIELHLSNIYKREEFRHKSLISGVVSGGIFGLGAEGYILAIISLQKTLQNENR
ncbi:type II 3-dehydroquinate dehydratase [Candidatus Pelagibacter communis]|uniref:type II 3-dehydroquinate dehydratase n=1 Tax=Pelagibacter ubique TaxID=198252 RepID=UPI00092D0480|nr:type II 3-dehydroquinate dehydratase [Candidatus Pelagibacter ubique]